VNSPKKTKNKKTIKRSSDRPLRSINGPKEEPKWPSGLSERGWSDLAVGWRTASLCYWSNDPKWSTLSKNGPNHSKQVDRVEYWAYPTRLVQAKRGPIQTSPSRFGLAKRRSESVKSKIDAKSQVKHWLTHQSEAWAATTATTTSLQFTIGTQILTSKCLTTTAIRRSKWDWQGQEIRTQL